MSDPDPVETIAEVIGGIDYDYEQRDQARRIVSAIRTGLELRRALWLALTADNPLSRLTKAPSSPTETTDAPEQRPDHTGVIRGADEAEARRMARYAKAIHDEAERLGVGRVMMLPEIVILARAVMAVADAEHAALIAEVERLKDLVAAREDTAERLWRELEEATNVPDDPTTNQLPVAPRLVVGHDAVGNMPMCLVHPEHFMPCSRCLGYGCTACDNGVQAADDRRSL